MNLKRVIKRLSVRPGKHALLISLFPLLCAAVLLALSGCGVRNLAPDNQSDDSGTSSSPKDGGSVSETSPPDSAERTLEPTAALDSLSNAVRKASDELANSGWETNPPGTVGEILPTAQGWFDGFHALTEPRRETSELGNLPHRIKSMRDALGSLSENTPPVELVGNLRRWLDELTGILTRLNQTKSADTESLDVGGINQKLDAVSADLDRLSGSVDGISETVNGILKNPPRASLGTFGILFFAVAVLNFAFSIYLFLAIGGAMRELSARMETPTRPTGQAKAAEKSYPSDEINAIMTRLDRLDGLSDRLDALSHRIDRFQENASAPRSDSNSSRSLPSVKPKISYFQVTSSNGAGGANGPIYLQEKQIPGNIQGIPTQDNPQRYQAFPVMSKATDDGLSGVVLTTALYTGDNKVCFNLPQKRPSGSTARVTVKKPALIERVGHDLYQLISPGELNVIDGA